MPCNTTLPPHLRYTSVFPVGVLFLNKRVFLYKNTARILGVGVYYGPIFVVNVSMKLGALLYSKEHEYTGMAQ